MNPLTLRAENLRTFETLELDLPAGCIVIGGENGAGKSSILNAIDVALFAGRGELPPLLSLGEDELELTLEFEHASELYRVRRRYSAKGRGKTTLDLEKGSWPAHSGDDRGPQWEPLTRETADETQKLIERLLGLSRATFRASSFLAQGDGAAFTEAQPRDRKAILGEILGLAIWDKLLSCARADIRVAEDEGVELRGRALHLREIVEASDGVAGQLAVEREHVLIAAARLADAESDLELAVKRHADNAAAVERARAAAQALATAKENQERLRHAYAAAVRAGDEMDHKKRELAATENLAGRLAEFEDRQETARSAMAAKDQRDLLRKQATDRDAGRERRTLAITQLRVHAEELLRKAGYLDQHIDDAARCDRCDQLLGAEAAAKAAASYRAEALDVEAKAAAADDENNAEYEAIADLVARAAAIVVPETIEDLSELAELIAQARFASEKRAAIAEQINQLAEIAATEELRAIELADAADQVRLAEEQVHRASASTGEEHGLQQAVTEARRTVEARRAILDDHKTAVTKLEETANRAHQAQTVLEQITAETYDLVRRIDILKLAERAYGRDGIPALIVENAAIPQLEMEANRILGELGGKTAECRVELRTQRAQKTTETLRETLDIVVVTPKGELPYEQFSGGEKTRLNLALRISLARLLAHRRGAESRLLAIDEPEYLDEAGVGRLADVLRGLAGDFDRVILVSHNPTLASSFDQALTVTNDGDRSRVDVSVPVEEVAV